MSSGNEFVLSEKKKPAQHDGIPFLLFSRAPSKIGTLLEIVETPQQYRTMLSLRKKIFIEKEGYPYSALCNGYERESVSILAKAKNQYVGMISVKLNDINGLPIEKYIDLSQFGDRKIAEFDKLGVLDIFSENVQRSIFYELVGAAYGLVRFCGYNSIVIFTLRKKSYNINIYEKMGFQEIGSFVIFDNVEAVAMLLDLDKANGLMWSTSQLTKLAKRLVFSVNNNRVHSV